MYFKKALVFLMALTAVVGRDTQWYKFPNRRVSIIGATHHMTTAFQNGRSVTFSKAQLDIHDGTSTAGTLLHTLVNPLEKESGTAVHTIKAAGGEAKFNYFFFDFFLDDGKDTYLQASMVDSDGASYSGGGVLKFASVG